MDSGVAWLEALCQQLVQNPRSVSDQFDSFRNSDSVLDVAKLALQSPQTTAVTKFYALSAVQYALLMRWETLAAAVWKEWIGFAEVLVGSHAAVAHTSPSFLGNKIVQFYVSLHKRSWVSLDVSERQKMVSFAFYLMQLGSVQAVVGSALLVCIVEEFASLRFTDHSLTISVFNKAKSSFEGGLLEKILSELQTIVYALGSKLSAATDLEQDLLYRQLGNVLKCMNSIVIWNYGEQTVIKGAGEDGETSMSVLMPPPSLAAKILNPEFVSLPFSLYKHLRGVFQDKSPSIPSAGVVLTELRSLVSSLAQVSAGSLEDQKLAAVDHLVAQFVQFIQPSISRHTMELLTFESEDYELEGNMRAFDLQTFVGVAQALVITHGVDTLMRCGSFPQMVMLLGQITREMDSELGALVADVVLLSARANFESDGCEVAVLDSWRADLLSSLLMMWTALQDDYTLAQNVGWSGQDGGASHSTMAGFMASLSADLFPSLFNHMLQAFASACLQAGEDGDEERDQISEERLQTVLGNLSVFARMNVSANLVVVTRTLASIHGDLQNAMNNRNKDIFCLEYMRLTILVLSYILIDDYSAASESPPSGESPVINSLVLDALLVSQTQEAFLQSLQLLLVVLQQQLTGVSSSTSCKESPAVVECVFALFSLLMGRYIDPCIENYNSASLARYPLLSTAWRGNVWNPLLDQLLRCLLHCLHSRPFEENAIQAACKCLYSMTKLSGPERLTHMHHSALALESDLLGSLQRLTGPSLALAAHAVLNAALRFNLHSSIHQILSVLSSDLALFAEATALSERHTTGRSRSLALLTALARLSASELDHAIFDVFQSFLSMMLAPATAKRCCLLVVLERNDDLLPSLLSCLQALMENLLIRLPEHTSKLVYILLLRLFEFLTANILPELRTRMNTSSLAIEAFGDCLISLLDILNNLSTKEFIILDENLPMPFLQTAGNHAHANTSGNALPQIILFGLGLLLPFLSPLLVRTYPTLADKVISLVLYTSSSFKDVFVQWLQSISLPVWRDLVHNILCICTHTHSANARQAFQILQLLGALQVESIRTSGRSLFHDKDQDFVFVLQVLLRMLLVPQFVTDGSLHPAHNALSGNTSSSDESVSGTGGSSSSSLIVTMDRQDAFANVLVTFFVLCGTSMVQPLVLDILQRELRLSAMNCAHYLQQFQTLTTERGVLLDGSHAGALLKSNRQLFTLNFRQFIVHIKALNAAHLH